MARALSFASRPRACTGRSGHRGAVSARAAAPSDKPLSWSEIAATAGAEALKDYWQYPNNTPSSSPTPLVPTTRNATTTKPVLFYRDTNGWCPFCQRVWMVLLEKDIPFDCMLINLRKKPEWYSDVVPSALVPAIRIDGKVTSESYEIMMLLDSTFRSKPLMPRDAAAREACEAFMAEWIADPEALGGAAFRVVSELTARAATAQTLDLARTLLGRVEAVIEAHGGPYLFGEFSLADVLVGVQLARLTYVERPAVDLADYPRVAAMLDAFMARPSFAQTALDAGTLAKVVARSVKPPAGEADTSHIATDAMRRRREAAGKLAANRGAVTKVLLLMSGVVRQQGSAYGQTMRNVNGRSVNPAQLEFAEQAELALRRVCTHLLLDAVGPAPKTAEAVAVQVAMVAYLRNLGSAPRDMSAKAIEELRKSCDAVMRDAYTGL